MIHNKRRKSHVVLRKFSVGLYFFLESEDKTMPGANVIIIEHYMLGKSDGLKSERK